MKKKQLDPQTPPVSSAILTLFNIFLSLFQSFSLTISISLYYSQNESQSLSLPLLFAQTKNVLTIGPSELLLSTRPGFTSLFFFSLFSLSFFSLSDYFSDADDGPLSDYLLSSLSLNFYLPLSPSISIYLSLPQFLSTSLSLNFYLPLSPSSLKLHL